MLEETENTPIEPPVDQKREIKVVVPIYPTASQARGLIRIFLFVVLVFGLPLGWFAVEQRVTQIEAKSGYWIVHVDEQPGFLRRIFRPQGEQLYIRRIDSEEKVEWFTYPDSRQIILTYPYEDMFKSSEIEKKVKSEIDKKN